MSTWPLTNVTFWALPASKNNIVNLVMKSGSPRTTTQAHPPLSMPSSSTVIVSLLIMFSSSDSLLLPSPFSSLSVSEPMIGTLLSSTVILARLTVVERESKFLTILSLSLKQDLFASIECYGDSRKAWSTAFKRQTSSDSWLWTLYSSYSFLHSRSNLLTSTSSSNKETFTVVLSFFVLFWLFGIS